jgi:hypothetical protein
MGLRSYEFLDAARFCHAVASPGQLDLRAPTRWTAHPAGEIAHAPPRYVCDDDPLTAPGQVSAADIDLRAHKAQYSETFLATLPDAMVEKFSRIPTLSNPFNVFIDDGVALGESFHNRTSAEYLARLMGECLPVRHGDETAPVKVTESGPPDLTVEQPCLLMASRFIHHNYYHWIFEGLTRFWCREHLPDFDKMILVMPSSEFRPFHTGILERMGLSNRILVLNHRLTRFRQLYFPSFLDPGTVTARQVEWLRRTMFTAFPAADRGGPRRRIYVSRQDAKARIVSNETALMEKLAPLGFELIVPGRMTLEEQVSAFAGAEIIVAPHGAANAGLAFCRPGTPFVELVPAGNASALYWMQANVGRLPYGRVICREDQPLVSMVADGDRVAAMAAQALADRHG